MAEYRFESSLPGEPDALQPIQQVAAMLATREWRRRARAVAEATVPHELAEKWQQEALDWLSRLAGD